MKKRNYWVIAVAILVIAGAAAATLEVVAGKHASMASYPEAYVAVKLGNEVEVVPEQKIWAGGPTMLYDALTPDGKRLLVTSPQTGSVYVFDTASGKQLAVIQTGEAAKGVKISPDGKEAYVSNEGEASVSVIDLGSLKAVAKIKTAAMPHNVRFTADGTTAYVTLQGGAGLGVIDTRSRKVIRIIPIPGIIGPHNLDLSPDEKTAYVRDTSNKVAVLDLASGKVEKLIDVGAGHAGIDVTPDGKYVVTGAIGDHVVTVIDRKTNSVVKRIDVGMGPHGVRASADSRWIYVTVTADNRVAVIDARSLKVVKTYPTGDFPFWVAVHGNV